MKLPRLAPEDCETLGTQTATYSRCDMNGHLNNTRYADIVCDAVPWEVWDTAQISDFIINYHREVPRGENFTLRRARCRITSSILTVSARESPRLKPS